MSSTTFSHHAMQVAFFACVTLLVQLDARAIDIRDGLPTPGLYQIDGDSTITMNPAPQGTASIRLREEGATGDATGTWTANGHAADRAFKGSGPRTVCMQPSTDTSQFASLPAGLKCVTGPVTRSKEGMTFTSHCSFADVTTTIHQVDSKTWEYLIHTVQHAQNPATAMQDNMSAMRMMMENVAKNGATAEERDKAKKALAQMQAHQKDMEKSQDQMAAMQPQMEKMRADARAKGVMPTSANNQMETTSKQRWTRIADQCSGVAKK